MEIQAWTPAPPSQLFAALSEKPFSFFLNHEKWTLLGHAPFLVFKSKGSQIDLSWRNGPKKRFVSCDPLKELSKLYDQYKTPFSSHPFFQGGLIGYFGYDLVRMLETLPSLAIDDQKLPDILIGFYDCAYLYEQDCHEGKLLAIPLPKENVYDVQKKIEDLKRALSSKNPNRPLGARKTAPWISHFTKRTYLEKIKKAKDYIAAGDIYQVNLSQRFTTQYPGRAFPLFESLIKKNPAPYSGFFNTPELTLLSLSPERFLKIENRRIQTCPIKGTRPRGQTPAQDQRLKEELLKSKKDDAELLMITDLERNDLGRVCEYGSVQVTDLKHIETHPTVFHLVAEVEGNLKKDLSPFDVLRAVFPGGSITGAPKIRAIQIIEELEPTRRNLYTGTFGFLSFNGVSDLSILIRTLIKTGETISFQVGSGIVADSDPQAEYQETLDKGKTFFDIPSSKILVP